jgi:signal transduction histidine kinase
MESALPTWLSQRTGPFRRGEWLAVCIFYVLSATAYHFAIYLSSSGNSNFWRQAALDYSLKLLLTGFFWWIVFVKMRHLPLFLRLGAHVAGAPAFTFLWQAIYYAVCEALGLGHLEGPGSTWDIYIPMLFYILQFGIFHVYESYHTITEQQRREAALRESALKSELAALRSQLNPHFLYNAFNAINASLPAAEERSRELIAELSDMFRYVLSAMRRDLVPVKEEMAFVKKYLHLEQARFGERLQFVLDIDPAAESLLLPPLLIQPLVENAVKHGIGPKMEGGSVQVRIWVEHQHIGVRVADTGLGFHSGPPGQKGEGVGLDNTRLRLLKMYGEPLFIHENSPTGTQVTFSIPINEYEKSHSRGR